MRFTKKDSNPMTWDEVLETVSILIDKINKFSEKSGNKINIISPLLRTGGIIGGLVSIKMKVLTMLPVQFKYSYNPKKINQIFSVPDLLIDNLSEKNILLCEGNTSSGSMAEKSAFSIKEKYPEAKIYLATLTKVYGGPEKLDGIEEVFYGRLTDENLKASDEEIEKFNLRKGITVFPWESVEDELSDLNSI